jgi:DNA-binding NarL/FixJ family response regulator
MDTNAPLNGRGTPRAEPTTGGRHRPLRIVIAGNHGLMLAGVRRALEFQGGFEIVAEACRAERIMPLIARTNPAVVLLDARVPGMDGLACLHRLQGRFPDVKVVISSTSNDPDHIQAAFSHGACGYVLSSINPMDLGSAIRQAVEGTAYHAHGLPAMREDTAASAAGLSDRELEVLRHISHGMSNSDVAAALWVTVQTVKFHLSGIYRKLGVSNRTEAARWALAKGLVGLESASAPADVPDRPAAVQTRSTLQFSAQRPDGRNDRFGGCAAGVARE